MRLRGISIKNRLSMLVYLTLAIIALGSVAGMSGVLMISSTVDQIAATHKMELAADEIASVNASLQDQVMRMLVQRDPAMLNIIRKEMTKTDSAIGKAEKLADNTDSKDLVNKIRTAYSASESAIEVAVADSTTAGGQDVAKVAEQVDRSNQQLVEATKNYHVYATNLVDEAGNSALNLRKLGLVVVAIMMLITLGIAGSVGLAIAASINKPLSLLGVQATKIGEGDVTAVIEVTGKDEIGHLEKVLGNMTKRLRKMINEETETKERLEKQVSELSELAQRAAKGDLTVTAPEYEGELGEISRSFNEMTSGLRRLAEKMAEVINHLSSASSQIEVTAQQQASGSNEQAASVSEVTAAINELATNAKEVALAAESVSEAANESLDGARKGADSVEDAASGMEEIKEVTYSNAQKIMALEEKSQEIGSILAIIDDIAEQTNLLALNAAIEAARAGEAGKGFAVVAQEIRNLAEDVTSSTKEISEKIKEIQTAVNSSVMATEESQKRTEEETRVVREAGEGLKRIGILTERTAELALQISGAVQQQRTASEQVVQTMNEVSEVARQSALGSQESVKSAQDLATMASDLKEMISVFKFDRRG